MSLQIFIADDDQDDVELLEEAILEREPASAIEIATNGKAAIEKLDKLREHELPHLIILDYNMPGLGGSAVLDHLSGLARYRHIPRVVLSTSDAELYKRECLEKGAVEYFVKPATKRELDAVAGQMLDIALKP